MLKMWRSNEVYTILMRRHKEVEKSEVRGKKEAEEVNRNLNL